MALLPHDLAEGRSWLLLVLGHPRPHDDLVGVSVLYRGMSLNAVRAIPSQGIQFATYELLKTVLGVPKS